MPCLEPEKISAFLDGELSQGEEPSFESHLASCAACCDLAARLKGARALFERSYKELQPTGDLGAFLWQEIQPGRPRWVIGRSWNVPAFASLVLALALGAWLLFLKPGPGPVPVYASGRIQCSVRGIKGACCVMPIVASLKKIHGVAQVRVNAKGSSVELITEKGKAVEVSQVARALRDCGNFSLGWVDVHPESE